MIGAIAGPAAPLALAQPWQVVVLAGAAVWLPALRRGVVTVLALARAVGAVAAVAPLQVTG